MERYRQRARAKWIVVVCSLQATILFAQRDYLRSLKDRRMLLLLFLVMAFDQIQRYTDSHYMGTTPDNRHWRWMQWNYLFCIFIERSASDKFKCVSMVFRITMELNVEYSYSHSNWIDWPSSSSCCNGSSFDERKHSTINILHRILRKESVHSLVVSAFGYTINGRSFRHRIHYLHVRFLIRTSFTFLRMNVYCRLGNARTHAHIQTSHRRRNSVQFFSVIYLDRKYHQQKTTLER